MNTNTIWVDDINTLDQLSKRWLKCSYLAIDTEFIRVSTFYPKLALIQIKAELDHIFLIDPLSIPTPPASFKALMDNDKIIKIIHACVEDIEVLESWCGLTPNRIFDTQIAYAMIQDDLSISYQNLVKHLLHQDIPKGETRSDWLQRPLTESQINYAALDVAHLPALYTQLNKLLSKKQRTQWVFEEFHYQIPQPLPKEMAYQKLKGAWQFDQHQLAILKHLAAWREQVVRNVDIPRSFVFKDSVLIEIAKRQPTTLSELKSIFDISHRSIRRFGEQVLEELHTALHQEHTTPCSAPERPLNPEEQRLYKQVKRFIRYQAKQLELAPELLVRKKDLQSLLMWPITKMPKPGMSALPSTTTDTDPSKFFSHDELAHVIDDLEHIQTVMTTSDTDVLEPDEDEKLRYQLETPEGLRPLPSRLLGWRFRIITEALIDILLQYKHSSDKKQLFKAASPEFLAASQQDMFE